MGATIQQTSSIAQFLQKISYTHELSFYVAFEAYSHSVWTHVEGAAINSFPNVAMLTGCDPNSLPHLKTNCNTECQSWSIQDSN